MRSRSLRLYSLAQRLYPAPFRSAYSKQQVQTVSDMLDHAVSPVQRLSVWVTVWADLVPSLVSEQIHYQGAVLMSQTPKFLKTTSLISALMLLPFLLAISANATDRLILHHDLYNSWLWHFPALGLWVVWLPQAALLVALAGFIAYLIRGPKDSWIHRAVNLRRTWMLLVPGLLAVGIMVMLGFHDSVRCLKVSPLHLVTHMSSVYRCVTNNSSLSGFRKFF